MHNETDFETDERYEERMEARREALADDFDRVAAECADCGERWNPRYHRATRSEPAYEAQDTCPYCGSGNRVVRGVEAPEGSDCAPGDPF